jgi:hypothetical protein
VKFYLLDKNKGKPGRKPNLWWRYKPPGSPQAQEPCRPGVKAREAQRVELTRQIEAGTWIHPSKRKVARMTFEAFALRVVELRTEKGVGKNESPPNKTERGHVVNHLIPAFGKYTFPELSSFKLIKDGFDGALDDDEPAPTAINHKGLSGRMIRNVHTTFRTILHYAVDEGLMDVLPPPLQVRRDQLPPCRDVDPQWREWNKFERSEVIAIANAQDIVTCRRTSLLTFFCTGPRYCELAEQRVHHYNRDGQPLNMLTVRAAKLGRHAAEGQVRHVPVLPELQLWLDWYLDEEYEILFGHRPRPDDYLFPPYTAHGKSSGVGYITHSAHHKQFVRNDMPAAGIGRPPEARGAVRVDRGIHDARRTLIGLMRSARCDDRLIRAMTHRGTSDNVLDAYTNWEWAALCQELSKVRFGLPLPPYRNAPPIQLVPPVPSGRGIDVVSDLPRITAVKSTTSGYRRKR